MTLNIQGGVCQFEDEVSQGRGGYFGWMGFGGYIHKFHCINFSGSYSFCITDFNFLLSVIRSVFQWHPELKIGFGCVSSKLQNIENVIIVRYVPTLLTWIDLTNNKARLLQVCKEFTRMMYRAYCTPIQFQKIYFPIHG